MIVNDKNEVDEKSDSIVTAKEEAVIKEYRLLEMAILNILLNIKFNKNSNKKGSYYSAVKDLMHELPTKSRRYIYTLVKKLELKGFVVNITPRKREKLIMITKEGETALTTIIKYLFPGKKQQETVLRMFYDSKYISK